MGESLWDDLDEWQIDHLEAQLGPDSAYETLVVQMVAATIVRDYHEWDNADEWQFPAVIVGGAKELRALMGVQHMTGSAHFRKSLPYSWLGVVEGDRFTALKKAKIMAKRLERAAIAIMAAGWGPGSTIPLAPDDSGEKLTTFEIGETNIALFRRASAGDVDPYYGVASIDIDFITTV